MSSAPPQRAAGAAFRRVSGWARPLPSRAAWCGEARLLRQLSSEDLLGLQASVIVSYSLLGYHEHLRARYVALRQDPGGGTRLLGWMKRLF